jgi:cytochrome P450
MLQGTTDTASANWRYDRGPFSTATNLRRRPLETYMRAFAEQGDVVRFRLGGPFEAYLVAHPSGVDRVMRTAQDQYGKVPWHNARFRELLGDGIATSEGDRWLSRRRLVQPAFHSERVSDMVDTMTELTLDTAAAWDRLPAEAVIDMSRDMMALTLSAAARCLFGVDVSSKARGMGPHIDETLHQIVARMESLIAYPFWIPLPANRRFVKARSTLDEFIMGIIERRRADPTGPRTMLDLLIESVDGDTGEPLTDKDLRDEVMTMLMAGHESTSTALTWAWYLLAKHPDQFDRLRAEANEVLGVQPVTAQSLAKLKFTGMVIDEALRLYPPAWSTTRMPLQDDIIGGRRIPRGKFVILSPFVTHRHPEFWPSPERFDPERFANGVPRGDLRFSYFPFGGGPRQCLGLGFALTEAKVILATLASRFRPRLAVDGDVGWDPQVTLRPRGGMPMHVD